MAFELSVNLEYMFQEAGERLEDRVAAAAAAGFRKAEMFTTEGAIRRPWRGLWAITASR
jgi:hydroxypyruvate isomerase